jgi:hypothetical protein
VIWERASNRHLDLSAYFSGKNNHVIVEDKCWDDVNSKPGVKPVYGEGAAETDALIQDDLDNSGINTERARDIMYTADESNLPVN